MRQIFENIFSLRAKINNLFHQDDFNSHNIIEYHFHGPVNFISKQTKGIKKRINSSHFELRAD